MNRKSLVSATLVKTIILALFTALNLCPKASTAQTGNKVPSGNPVEKWMTTSDQSSLLKKQATRLNFSKQHNELPSISIDQNKRFQDIDGFGYTLTGSSAKLIHNLPAAARMNLLQELFGNTENSIGISYLRLSIAASDLNEIVFSYDDLPAGETDPGLAKFNLSQDTIDLIPLLSEILKINPNIKIMATPWSAPVWMKDNGNSMGGHLLPKYYETYAQYFVKFIQAMKQKGIVIDAITPQNEPLHDGNNPSMVMTAEEQGAFISKHLGPAFRQAGISTKIVLYDHNCDRPDYPLSILKDPAANPFVNGSAFHLYGGEISVLSELHDQFPGKNLYFTEQWTGSKSRFDEDFSWSVKNIVIGSMRNWSRVALEWNLANDPKFAMHTPGGCTECKGALTIGKSISRNVSYYIIAHASKFVPAGSVRIESNTLPELPNVAFLTPAGKKVVLVLNEGKKAKSFNLKENESIVTTSLPAGAVATFTW